MPMQRCASIVELKFDRVEEYKQLHAAVWPEVLQLIAQAQIRNFSIYLRRLPDGKYYLFSYFEYIGDNFADDLKRMADHPTTQKWWDVCKPCHEPLPDRGEGDWWAAMEEVFHVE